MAEIRRSLHGEWASRLVFILAVAGSAIGLGNIWKFPYITGQNGGGAFVLVYLACILLIGIPIMMAEILIGRRGRRNPAEAMRLVAEESNRSPQWKIVGKMAILAGFIILSFYCVIAGWAFDYMLQSTAGVFQAATPASVQLVHDKLMANPWRLLAWSTLILALTFFIIVRGVKKGLEVAIRFMFPIMLILLLILVGYSIKEGSFLQGVDFLFRPDFSKLSTNGFLVALGHAFFTLSLASGSVMMYGAYLPKDISISSSTIFIASADTLVALLAGLAIFPIVFAYGLAPSAGPGLLFQSLPIAFGHMPYGVLFATLFFAMIVLAALTSTIAMIEPTVAWLIERFKMSRFKAASSAMLVLWVASLGSVLSFNYWSDVTLFGQTYFGLSDYLSSNIMLPLGGFLVAIFVGWRMLPEYSFAELNLPCRMLFHCWRFTLRYLSPLAIIIIGINLIYPLA